MTIRKRIEALAGGQVAVLVIVGLVATYMLWGQRDDAWLSMSVIFMSAAFVCAAATVFLTFTWFGRKRND